MEQIVVGLVAANLFLAIQFKFQPMKTDDDNLIATMGGVSTSGTLTLATLLMYEEASTGTIVLMGLLNLLVVGAAVFVLWTKVIPQIWSKYQRRLKSAVIVAKLAKLKLQGSDGVTDQPEIVVEEYSKEHPTPQKQCLAATYQPTNGDDNVAMTLLNPDMKCEKTQKDEITSAASTESDTDSESETSGSQAESRVAVSIMPIYTNQGKPREIHKLNISPSELLQSQIRYFRRYDLDDSNHINSTEELSQLSVNLVIQPDLQVPLEEVERMIEDLDLDDGWHFDQFKYGSMNKSSPIQKSNP